MIIPVSSPEDERIAAYLKIRERDLVCNHEKFIAEGEVVLKVLLQSDYQVESLLISEKQAGFLDRIKNILPAHIPVFLAEQEVMDTIVGFHIHRGLLAIGKCRKQWDTETLLASLPENACVLGLVGLANHDNIGGIFRNAAAFGVDAVILDETCCNPLYRKALRVSVGGVLKVPFAWVSSAEGMVAMFSKAGFSTFALSPGGTRHLHTLKPDGRTALIFGAEGTGLPQKVFDFSESISIPMQNAFDSLNVATTSGIVLYQMQNTLRATCK